MLGGLGIDTAVAGTAIFGAGAISAGLAAGFTGGDRGGVPEAVSQIHALSGPTWHDQPEAAGCVSPETGRKISPADRQSVDRGEATMRFFTRLFLYCRADRRRLLFCLIFGERG